MISIHNKNETNANLSQWIKNFANTNYYKANFLPETVREATYTYLHNVKLPAEDAEIEQLLDSLGFVSAIALGDETIAWSVATNRSQASEMIEQYSTSTYSRWRKALGIDSHWILLVDPEVMFTIQDLYEAHMDLLELEDKPECVIVEL
jgi:hypothetical protein